MLSLGKVSLCPKYSGMVYYMHEIAIVIKVDYWSLF